MQAVNNHSYPLSLPQKDVYFEQMMLDNPSAYNIGAAIYVSGDLNIDYLNKAYNQVIKENDVLRSILCFQEDEPYSTILDSYYHIPEEVDFSSLPSPSHATQEYIRSRFQKPFELREGTPLHQFIVIKIGLKQFCILSMYHHLIVDGWGTSIIYKRWTELYNQLANTGEVKQAEKIYPYSEFVSDTIHYLDSEEIVEDAKFWENKFTILPERLCNLYEYRQQNSKPSSVSKTFAIKRALYDELNSQAVALGGNMFHFFIAAITRYFGSVFMSKEIVIGLPILNRLNFAAKRTVGLYTGIIPIKVAQSGQSSIAQMMLDIKNELRNTYRHQKYPLSRIVKASRLLEQKRDLLHDIFFSYEKHDYAYQFEGCVCQVKTIANSFNRAPVTVYVREYNSNQDVLVDIVCNLEQVPEEIAESSAKHLETLLVNLNHAQSVPLATVAYLPRHEADEVVQSLSGSLRKSFGTHFNFLEAIESQVQIRPEKIAIYFNNQHISFDSLNRISNQICHYLRSNYGVATGDVIALYLSRTEWLIPCLLGIIKAGAAWLPIDIKSPKQRVASILSDSQAKMCLVEHKHAFLLHDLSKIELLEDMIPQLQHYHGTNYEQYPSESDLAYVIYTSGTTGVPKGVEIQHRALNNLLQSMAEQPGLQYEDKLLAITSYAFDISILEFFLPLMQGATVILANDEQASDPILLNDVFNASQPTVMQGTPSMLSMLVEIGWVGSNSLKLLSGGERMPNALAETLIYRCNSLWNMYGPTETTIWSTTQRITNGEVSIGQPIINTWCYILGADKELLPLGTVGELYIGGHGVTKGYRNNSKLTSQKLVQDPLRENNLIYKTGDLCYWKSEALHFVQRIDTQIKIRGHRIEVEEIENVLLKHAYVSRAVVLAVENNGNEKALVAYIIPSTDQKKPNLTEFLAIYLPHYMIPSFFKELITFPLTISGKVDTNALKNIPLEQEYNKISETSIQKIEDEQLVHLRNIWMDVLELEALSIDSNFFAIGGDSLKATKVLSRTNNKFQIRLDLRTLFKHPTLRLFYNEIQHSHYSAYEYIKPVPEGEHYPLSYAQQRIWILSQFQNGSLAYTMKEGFQLVGTLDIQKLRKAVRQLIVNNSILRTTFQLLDGEPRQIVEKLFDHTIFVDYIDLQYVVEAKTKVLDIVEQYTQEYFDLSKLPLFKILIIQTSSDNYTALVAIHHIIADGWSLNIIINQLFNYYNSTLVVDNLKNEINLDYKDYSVWNRNLFKADHINIGEKFWKDYFKFKVPSLNLPYNYSPIGRSLGYQGQVYNASISSATATRISQLAKEHKTTVHNILLGLYSILLHSLSKQNQFTVGIATAGRKERHVEDMIGVFVNFLPIMSKLTPGVTLIEHITYITEQILAVSIHEYFPLETYVDKLAFENSDRPILYNTLLVYHTEKSYLLLKNRIKHGIRLNPIHLHKQNATADLKLDIFETQPNGKLQCFFEYNSQLFNSPTVQFIASAYSKLIDQFVENASQKAASITLFSDSERQGIYRVDYFKESYQGYQLKVISSFTAEPLAPYVNMYAQKARIKIDIEFAPYNQVVQELLRLSEQNIQSTDIIFHLVSLRFEDYIANHVGEDSEKLSVVTRLLEELEGIFLHKLSSSHIYLVALLPYDNKSLTDSLKKSISEVYTRWRIFLQSFSNIQIIDFTQLDVFYRIPTLYDSFRDHMAHIPYTEEFFAAMGTMIVRTLYAYRSKPLKVIAVDCDNTLWAGVVGEVGYANVDIRESNLFLQEFLIKKHKDGFLIALVSKNNEQEVWDVFDKHPSMLLKKEMLSTWQINWQPKSESLAAIAEDLNISKSSILFIDDSPVECLEVLSNAPEVFVLRYIDDLELLECIFFHIWCLDKWKVTDEDRVRNLKYRQERSRKKLKDTYKTSNSLHAYLKKLELKVSFNLIKEQDIDRVSQLTFRTNQFNASSKRRTPQEIRNLYLEDKMCWVVEAQDNYGHYGLIGIAITQIVNSALQIDTLLLSCRALGRGIEEAVLFGISQYATEKGIKNIEVEYIASGANTPAKDFLERIFKLISHVNDRSLYRIDVATISKPNFISFKYREEWPEAIAYDEGTSESISIPLIADKRSFKNDSLERYQDSISEYLSRVISIDNLHYFDYEHLLHIKAESIVKLTRFEDSKNSLNTDNQLFKDISILYTAILKRNADNIDDDFFELGGHSLGATLLLSEIHRTFAVQIQLSDFFSQPTLRNIYQLVSNSIEKTGQLTPVTGIKEYELSKAQKRIWLLSQMRGGSQAYNLPALLEFNGVLNLEVLRAAFLSLIQEHDILRARFSSYERQPYPIQKIVELDTFDFVRLSDEFRIQGTDVLIRQLVEEPFDLEYGPLLKVYVLDQGINKHTILFIIHHIIADGWSLRVITDQVVQHYQHILATGKSATYSSKYRYKDFIDWETQVQDSADYQRSRTYWHNLMTNRPAETTYMKAPQQGYTNSFTGGCFALSDFSVTDTQIRSLGDKQGVTPFVLLLTSIKCFLNQYLQEDIITVGTVIDGRERWEFRDQIGIFVDSMLLMTHIDKQAGFRAQLPKVKRTVLGAYAHKHYSYYDFIAEERTKGIKSLAGLHIMVIMNEFNVQHINIHNQLSVVVNKIVEQTSRFDLCFNFEKTSDTEFGLTISYNDSIFDLEEIRIIAKEYRKFMGWILEYPDVPLAEYGDKYIAPDLKDFDELDF